MTQKKKKFAKNMVTWWRKCAVMFAKTLKHAKAGGRVYDDII